MKHLIVVLCTTLLSSICLALTPEQRGLEIAIEVDRQDIGFGDSQSNIVMILKDKYGNERTRQMRNRTLEQSDDGDKSMIIFDSPGDVKGTAFLSFTHRAADDDQWLFLPALKRVKKISSSNKAGAFMSSEFAFEDIASQEVDKYSYTFLRDDKYQNTPVLINQLQPKDPASGYSKLEVWVDAKRYIPLKIDFYNRGGKLKKTLELSDYSQYLNKFWRAGNWTMVNHITGKSTVLKMQDWQFRNGFDDQDFNKNSLSRAK
ncbi:outer membrane lipoprotein-sorting protein [Teredinibacter waterburyi]|uniref:outer membrane lipoprotein-sorting protein n=1 Tax=Teredinibacter waterburyi TaxID=1500538 RepID=UPI00165FD04D|nr:outer membrane lipoprotein-sorting protein [Teredinibacter waterburyi]